MNTLTFFFLGWLTGCVTVFGWAVVSVYLEARRHKLAVAKARAERLNNVSTLFPPKENN